MGEVCARLVLLCALAALCDQLLTNETLLRCTRLVSGLWIVALLIELLESLPKIAGL